MTRAFAVPLAQHYKPLRPRRANIHPVLGLLFEELAFHRISINELSRVSGVSQGVISAWQHGASPRLANAEAALNSIGYTLVAVPLKEPT